MKSKAASSGTEGKITERIEGNERVGYRENGTIAWTMKTKLRTTPAENLRTLMFGFVWFLRVLTVKTTTKQALNA